ncbi:MAG TPA: hypothetical protein VMX37_00500 [Acidimicrobiia bacterium]|nr:hypothetical protein [Acidimicrobiia bacterium]
MKRCIVLLAAGALLLAACGDEVDWPTTTGATTTSTVTSTTAATTTTGATTTTQVTTTSAGNAGDAPADIRELMAATEELRGRRFLEPIEVTVLSPEDLAARVRADLEEDLDPDDLAVEQAFGQLLGILPADIDLAVAVADLYAEQVGGFYDSDTGELVVAGGEELSPLARTIIVHELVHALADQHFGLGVALDGLTEAEDFHRAAALQALAEGDATYFQMVYLQEGLSPEEQMEAVLESLETDTTVLDSLPGWIGEDLAFPYEWGFGFVEQLVEEGGIAAVDQAYELLPTTVEQIMHPNAYLTLEPARPVTLAATALGGYEVYEEGEFGEWNLMLYLLDGIGDGDATVAAGGWGGDAYRIHWDGSRVAFAYLFEGDTPRDAEELAPALVDSLEASMAVGSPVSDEEAGTTVLEGEAYAFVQRVAGQVLLVVADDPAAGRALVGTLRLEAED